MKLSKIPHESVLVTMNEFNKESFENEMPMTRLYMYPEIVQDYSVFAPSICPICSTVLTYMKLSKIPHSIKAHTDACISPSKSFPMLAINGMTIKTGGSVIISYLMALGYNIDKIARADEMAYYFLVTNSMNKYLIYYLWYKEENYQKYTKDRYKSSSPFPFGGYYERRLRKEKISEIPEYLEENGEKLLQIDLNSTLYTLVCKLQDRRYFGDQGNKPSTLDAVVYGYLSILLCVEEQLFEDFPSLVDYCNRIQDEYYNHDISEVDGSHISELYQDTIVKTRKTALSHEQNRNSRYTLTFGIIVIALFVVYGDIGKNDNFKIYEL
eukprot:TRINITY_DN1415_c0_g1_i1.p1 TRINITY_DN1415_c0_g1~~TRINITY_DN1415_c0_g1_i1.p1  ORF type:complete len:325 (+),score=41.90 TRINITY_DN1415_c0_g1_i1:1-975(+)